MIEYATALARFLSGYWNKESQTEANPGGFGANGHTENLPAVAEAIGVVAQEVATQAGAASTDAGTATGAAAAAVAARDVTLTARDVAVGAADAAAQSAVDAAGAVGGLKVSSNDTLPGSLEDKLLLGDGLTASTQNDGGAETRTVAVDFASSEDVATGEEAAKTVSPATLHEAALKQGKHTIAMPAAGMAPRTTNGAAHSSEELSANDVMIGCLAFDAATVEAAQFAVPMPASWNGGTITARFFWKHPATTTNFAVVWGIRARASGDDDALDSAWGAGVTVTDTGGTTADLYISAETGAVTVGGTPAAGDLVIVEVYRDAAAGGDTLAVDAHLIAVHVHHTISAATDA